MKIALITILTAVVTLFVGVFVAYNYVPLSWFDALDVHQPQFGSTITTILGTDTLSASRSVINTNFSNLNTDKAETTVTTLANLTTANALTSATSLATLAALSTVGTITTGVWNGTAVTVPFGGTASTTLSANQVLLGNGAAKVMTVTGWGNVGEALTSNGTILAPTWQSAGVNQAANYTWTGINIWTAAASSTRFAALDTLYIGRTATSTLQGSTVGTSTLQGFLNILGTNSTSTISGNLGVTGTTSTQTLVVNGNCTNCATNGWEKITNTGTGPTTGGTTVDVVMTCSTGKHVMGGGGSDTNNQVNIAIFQSYPSATNAWTVSYVAIINATANTITGYAICVN